jgi:SAM-dependent methyltransferase
MKSLLDDFLCAARSRVHGLNFWALAVSDGLKELRGSRVPAVSFRCNICGGRSRVRADRLTREGPTCPCGSTVRLRALVHLLSEEIHGESLALPDFPSRPDIVGVDMSGAGIYARGLAGKFSYTNTFLHKPPRLDIVEPGAAWLGRCDFIISSDVFEHVAPPVSRAFANTLRLLKPGGVFVFTVPYGKDGDTQEHFPELHDYRLRHRGGKRVLVNTTAGGILQEFDKLVFHGGAGETLEMRVFSEAGVLEELRRAGFEDIRIRSEPHPGFGILWEYGWSLPISARRPA